MEIRVLQYFLAIAREETIVGAAEALHITQPTLSRQMKDLEDELGKKLFIRSNKKITLTDEGMLLRQRAEEIVSLVHKTELEITSLDSLISGNIYIGSGESRSLKVIIKTMKKMQSRYTNVKFNLYSGNADDVIDKLDNGLIDFALITEHPKLSEYNHLRLPLSHQWVVMMKKDDSLSCKESITFEDIKLNIISSYTLLYNASLMVEEGLGYAICFDKLINTTGNSLLTYRPLTPSVNVENYFIWKKYQVLTKASQCFLDLVQETIKEST
ncbi:LysR family transcriptional regulator [uncultured Sharpea sp.]|uniref:LysR family transcriptional regulator n=1 Tax=uncultured Sharpea sp. TaxID=1112738 RepID=UPI002583A97F|nr:LysR family transcriptional regulator [uncultured Sharpea sp.]